MSPIHGLATEIRIRHLDPVVHLQRAVGLGVEHFLQTAEQRNADALGRLGARLDGQVVGAEDDVLRRREDRLAGRRREDVRRRHHEEFALHDRFERQRHVDGHLVTVEVRVVGGTDERVNADGFAFDQDGLERLDRQTVERRCAIEQHRMALRDFLEDVPDFWRLLLDHLARTADGVHEAEFLEAADDERLEKNERHLLRQTALVELELRTDDDDGTAGVIDALAEQVLAETTLLALEHVREGLQGTIAGARHRAAMTTVVEQRVDCFLQHALFVVNDHIGRLQLHQIPQTIIAVDDAAIEIVEIGGRKAATFQRNERAQVRRNDGQHFENHPLRTALRVDEALDDLQTLRELLLDLLRFRRAHLLLQLGDGRFHVGLDERVAHRFGAHLGDEGVVTVFVERLAVLGVGEELLHLERRLARIDDHVVLVVDHALERARGHVEQAGRDGSAST